MSSKPKTQIDLNDLSQKLVDNIETILHELEIREYEIHYDRISFPCPVHEGDNPEGACLFTQGDEIVGNWSCWTQFCQDEIVLDKGSIERPLGKTIFGFIRGVLRNKYDRHVEYGEAISWAASRVDRTKSKDSTYNIDENLSILNKQRKTSTSKITREQIRESLVFPANFFLERGFSSEILDKYDVGFCTTQGKPMYNRVVCPFYDDAGKYMVGCIGRTIQPFCKKCKHYHYDNMDCPENKIEKLWGKKWRNNKGFNAENYLYNYWFAKHYISKHNFAILVEGQPDVWRLEESDIPFGVGISGASLKDSQKELLDELGVLNLLIITDNDPAGIEARKKIAKRCERYYNCHFVDLPKKDIGDMTVEEVKQLLGKKVEKLI